VGKHAVVFVDVERDQSTDRGNAVQRVEEEPVVFRERHHASIREFENFSSVKAKTRRRTPLWINSLTWAFTFSTPASANTTGVVAESVAPRLASTSTPTLLINRHSPLRLIRIRAPNPECQRR
jgi:hypothetical protein